MKKILVIGLIAILCACASKPAATSSNVSGMDLDIAINQAAQQMESRIPSGTMIALVSVASPSNAFSTQVLTRLESAIVSSRKLVVVDRANLDKIREEQGFQLSGEVSDESAKAIGQLLGAGAIVTGSLTDLGDVYNLQLKAINIETATVAVSYLADLTKTTRIETLLATRDTPTVRTQPTTALTIQQQTPAPASTPVPAPTPTPIPTAPSAPLTTVYKIGDTGPAGGIIFYDKGDNSGGWRYLEAAPASTEFSSIQWAVNNASEVTGTRTAVGDGKNNTQAVVDYSMRTGRSMPAARQCARLQQGGYDDWFLPSQLELGIMYLNLKESGLGGFDNAWYWSSSEVNADRVWMQNFRNGQQLSVDPNGPALMRANKILSFKARAIRQF